jgi:hypothetical protein
MYISNIILMNKDKFNVYDTYNLRLVTFNIINVNIND